MQSFTNKDKNKNKIICFFNTKLAMIFFFSPVRTFTIVVLKILAFSTSKNILFILPHHFTIHQMSNVLFFITSFKII